MTRDEIIRMADEAGFETCNGDGWPNEWLLLNIEKFAHLVAAAEREACAKVCDDKAKETFSGQCAVWGDYFARAIRARGKETKDE
jgi:hypothetical protein